MVTLPARAAPLLACRPLFVKSSDSHPQSGGWPHLNAEIATYHASPLFTCQPPALRVGERFFIELMTSDRKLKASREGSKGRIDGTQRASVCQLLACQPGALRVYTKRKQITTF